MWDRRRTRWWGRRRLQQVGWVQPPITGYQLGEWEAFESLHGPILAQERSDIAGAIVAAAVYRAAGDRDATPSDFLPRWDGTPKQGDEDIIEFFTRLAQQPRGGAPSP